MNCCFVFGILLFVKIKVKTATGMTKISPIDDNY